MTDGKTVTSTPTANSFDQSSGGSVFNNFFDNEIPTKTDFDKVGDIATNLSNPSLTLLGIHLYQKGILQQSKILEQIHN